MIINRLNPVGKASVLGEVARGSHIRTDAGRALPLSRDLFLGPDIEPEQKLRWFSIKYE
jgi:hypothetical protein